LSITDYLLATFVAYGLPALFVLILVSCVGVPFPSSLALVASGSFAAQGQMALWEVALVAFLAAVAGDQIGYLIARRIGRRLIVLVCRKYGFEMRLENAEAAIHRWGGAGVFLSRWLIPSLSPWINVTSGLAHFPWPRFVLWDVIGNAIWVVGYVLLGWAFSDQVQVVAQILGNLAWTILGLLVAGLLGWQLVAHHRAAAAPAGALAA
jgi:membrane protein DedA with SNARE-associated domain